MEIIPYTLAENAGINPIRMVTELRNRHAAGDSAAGINVRRGAISNMWEEHVVQPLLVNTSEISLSTECVGMILKIGKIRYDSEKNSYSLSQYLYVFDYILSIILNLLLSN